MKIDYKSKSKKTYYYINERISYPSLRVINHLGKQIGVFKKEEALKLAKENGLDLVLIAPQASPPVVKLIDFKKFLYQENKKNRKAKKGIKKSQTKDLKLSLFVAPNDLERLAKKAQLFLKEGNQVRLLLVLKGREITKRQMATDLINNFLKMIGEVNISSPPKFQGRTLITVISRIK